MLFEQLKKSFHDSTLIRFNMTSLTTTKWYERNHYLLKPNLIAHTINYPVQFCAKPPRCLVNSAFNVILKFQNNFFRNNF